MSSRVKQKQVNRAVREQIAQEERRRRMIIVSIVAVAALLIAGIAGWAVYETQKPNNFATPAHVTSDKGGVLVASGPVKVEIYLDYLCPNCKNFENEANTTLTQLSQQGKIELIYHPIAILDGDTTPSGYSTRAVSAAGCASDSGKFLDLNNALFAQQPAEGSAGLTDDQIVKIGQDIGITDANFAQCVKSGKYRDWAKNNTDLSGNRGVRGTPTIFVANKKVVASADAILQAVDAASK